MVEDRLRDGTRIAQLVASEVTGHEDAPFDALAVVDADPDVEPTDQGAKAYDVEYEGRRLAEAFVMPERTRLELWDGLEAAEAAAERLDLRSRPVGGDPPRLVVFVEDGAEAKRVADVLAAAARALD